MSNTLDALGDTSPEWQNFRREPAKSWGIPPGKYDALLAEVTTLQRRDTGQWVLRLLARVLPRNKYALTWFSLGEDPRDPYDLNDAQLRALAKGMAALGIRTPQPPEQLVDDLAHLVDKPIKARVWHSPIGPRATFARPEAEPPEPEELELEEPEELRGTTGASVVAAPRLPLDELPAAERAHQAHALVVAGLQRAREGFVVVAEGCYHLHKHDGWLRLGYESLRHYLANPDVGMERSMFFRLAQVHRELVVEAGVAPERLAGADLSKVVETLPAVGAGRVSAEEAVADATALGFRDVRAKYRQLHRPDDAPSGADPGPEEPAVCPECGRPL